MNRNNRMGIGLMILGIWALAFNFPSHGVALDIMSIVDEALGAYMLAC